MNIVNNRAIFSMILERAEEFLLRNRAGNEVWFEELILCLLTSNTSFISAYKSFLQLRENNFFNFNEARIANALRSYGYRFPNRKANYISSSKWLRKILKREVNKRIKNGLARDWLMNNVKGLGLKEASHFLRNVGIFDYAIIDRHIVKFLRNKGYINSWKGYKREYLEVEKILNEVSSIIGIKVGILDLIIWYIQTKRILR